MAELMTTGTALRLAREVEFEELAEALEKAADANVDFVTITPTAENDGAVVAAPTGVMVAWMLGPSEAASLTVAGGSPDPHVTLAYLGEAADLDKEQQRQLIGVIAEVCQRHVGAIGTIGGQGTFENEGETVWWADVDIPQLAEIQADVQASLTAAGLPVSTDHGAWVPHVTLAYLPEGQTPPPVEIAPFPVIVNQLTVAIGGYRFDLPLQDIDWEDVPTEVFAEGVRTAFIPTLKAADAPDGKEWRYTLGPVYMPGQVDAHGDSIDADALEESVHEYVRSGDRRIRLQHNTDVVAGEWVGLLVWPWPVTVPVEDEGRLLQRTFPAGTPFMGVVWEPEVWELVKEGKIRGYSLGGFAEFVTADLGDGGDELAKFNQNHDGHGRFSAGPGGGSVSAGITPHAGGGADASSAAESVHAAAAAREPQITQTLTSLAEKHGANMVGLEYRLKTKESLERKIKADASAMHVEPGVAAAHISDAVRYTMQTDVHSYTNTAEGVLSELSTQGYSIRSKNYWAKGDPYQGLNVAVTDTAGQVFELQFHTPESLKVKEKVHVSYEKYRVSHDPEQRRKLWDQMTAMSDEILVPDGVQAIPTPKMQRFDPLG